MRNNSHSALHVICGSITDVELENQNFTVNVQDKHIYQHLTEPSNLNLLKRALTWQNLNLQLNVKLTTKQLSASEKDIEKLKTLVGDYLTVQDT